MRKTEMWPQLEYHPIQYKVWVCPKRFIYLPCGRQSGKTELALRRLVRFLPVKREWNDPRFFYCAPTYQQAKKIAWHRLLALIPTNWIGSPSDISKSDLIIKTIFGSELHVIGLDKPQRIEGPAWDGGVIDENSDIKPKTFDLSILPALVWRDGWCWFIGVPKRFGIGAVEYRDKFIAASKGELPDSAAFTWPSEGIVPKAFLELCRQTMDARDYDEQFNASWLSASGGVFHAFNRDYNVRPCSYNPDMTIIVSQDFNVNPMAWVIGHIHGDTFEVFDEIWIRNTNTPEALNVLLSRYSEHKGGFEIYGDASSRGRHTSAYGTDYTCIANNPKLKALGRTMHFSVNNPPKADRFAVTNARICDGAGQRRLFIDPHCKNLIHDLEVRSYIPGTRETKDTGDVGHPSDALGYFLIKRWPLNLIISNRQIITITKGAA